MKKLIKLGPSILKVICLSFVILQSTILFSQNENIRLLYHVNWKDRLDKKPKDQKKWQDFNLHSKMYARVAIPEEKTLPLIFNVIHIGGVQKVDNALIENQMQTINDAFAGLMSNNTGRDYSQVLASDTKIKFCFGDPNGNVVHGINYKARSTAYTNQEFASISDKKDGLAGAKKDEYINVWVTELPDEMGGIAIMPDQDSIADGIYIDPDFFGNRPLSINYYQGKTLVHLIGQYLGLKPLWGDGECSDDDVEDTPIHNGANYRCFPFSHVSLCSGYVEEMIGNFMDATPDDCSFMFTKGQTARMHAMLTDKGYRKKLLDGNILCENNSNNSNVNKNRIISKIENLDFTIVPNPATNSIEIIYENPQKNHDLTIEIKGIDGHQIKKITLPSMDEYRGNTIIDLSTINIGNYYLTITSGLLSKTKPLIKIN